MYIDSKTQNLLFVYTQNLWWHKCFLLDLFEYLSIFLIKVYEQSWLAGPAPPQQVHG